MANGHGGARPNSGPRKRPNPWALTIGERIDLAAYCREQGYDPVVRMIEMAEDEETSPAMRFACNREVARYVHPTLGNMKVEHSGKIEGDLAGKSAQELRELADGYQARRQGPK